jgi:MFS family permease
VISAFDPLKHSAFRRIWIASLFCNASQQIQLVTVGWIMVQLAATPQQIGLLQTASMLPMLLLSLTAGAVADNYNRRNTALAALAVAFSGALLLSLFALTHAITRVLILACCSIVGIGIAFFIPAWQASVVELVGAKSLPSAVSLNSMAANVARSVGPVIGGTALLGLGAPTTLTLNAILYVPMLIALYTWRPQNQARDLRPESLLRATFAGLRYITLAPEVGWILIRTAVAALGTSAVLSMLPLVARRSLHGDAVTYGLLLGAFGAGAVTAAVTSSGLRDRLAPELVVRYHLIVQGVSLIVLASSHQLLLSSVALFVIGACWVTNNAAFNVSIQLSAPRWIGARLVAVFYSSAAGGLALGAWLWGQVTSAAGIASSLIAAGVVLLSSPTLGLLRPLSPSPDTEILSMPSKNAPEVALELDGRNGPVILDITYRIHHSRIADFCALMHELQRTRRRNGAARVRLNRDIADPELWTERSRYPTWDDYSRARGRPTQSERALQEKVNALHHGHEPIRVRRLLAVEDSISPP